MKAIDFEIQVATKEDDISADGWMCILPVEGEEAVAETTLAKVLPSWLKADLNAIAKKRKFSAKAGSSLAFDASPVLRKSLVCVDAEGGMFQWLTSARKSLCAAAFDPKVKHLVIDLRATKDHAPQLADAFVSAITAALYKFPKYKGPSEKKSKKADDEDDTTLTTVTLLVDKTKSKAVEAAATEALTITSAGTNLVRWLGKRAGNDLTCKTYIDYVRSLAKERRWKFEHINHDGLIKMKAGAFLAVVQGSEHKDYGIIKVTYTPSAKTAKDKHLVLVGKGLVFDTGGHSLKPSAYMLGMHGDMAGSAVALALVNTASLEQWPVKVTAFLAIADNMIGPKSYKPNDVITTAKGTTIEIIDTDAEGRMVLSDTLFLASKEKAQLMMDFATLTGSCVRAIGTTFSGVFSNRTVFTGSLIDAGYKSGERVWPFPMDKEFSECLESTSADWRQCREKGGVDHMEASQLLMHFAGKETPWVHVDLSAAENPGGLGHVPSEETGFGVRFAREFIKSQLKF